MIVTHTIDTKKPIDPKYIKETEEASKKPIVFDEACPELSPAMLKQLRCAVRNRNRLLNREKA